MRDAQHLHLQRLEDRIALTAVSSAFNNAPPALVTQGHFLQSHVAFDNTTDTARPLGELKGERNLHDYVGFFDSIDVYRFSVGATSDTNIGLSDMVADADVYLLNEDRATVASSTNSGSHAESIHAKLSPGDYFVVVKSYEIWRSTNYTLHLDASASVVSKPDRAGDSFNTAIDIGEFGTSRSFTGSVGESDRADFVKFDVATPTSVSISLTNLQQDIDLFLYSGDQRRISSSQGAGTESETISATLAAGTYYLAIVPDGNAVSDFTLTMNLLETVAPPSQPEPSRPAAPDLSVGAVPVTEPPVIEVPVDEPLAAVPYFGTSRDWGVNSVNAPEAWAAGYTGQGVTVAVVDSGVQIDHADLADNIWVNTDEVLGDGIDNDGNGYIDDRFGWDFVTNDNNPADEDGHGTHVAGTIAALNNGFGATGVAYASTIMPIRVLDSDGAGRTTDVARGIRYAVDNGADIINLSLGGGYSADIHSALRYATTHDVLVVAASGNESRSEPGYPARHSETLSSVISVGAFDSSNRLAAFSNDVGSSLAVQVDAPGVQIYSTLINGRYGSLSGTSMAAPHVAGVAALTLAANPDLTSAELRTALTQAANVNVTRSDSMGGVNAAAAIPKSYGVSSISSSTDGPGGLPPSTTMTRSRAIDVSGRCDRKFSRTGYADSDRPSSVDDRDVDVERDVVAVQEVVIESVSRARDQRERDIMIASVDAYFGEGLATTPSGTSAFTLPPRASSRTT